MKTLKIIVMVCLLLLIHSLYSFAESDTLKVGFKQAWQTIILTLQQDSILITDYDESNGILGTDYIEAPWNKNQQIAGRRFSYMGKFDESAAIWEKMRYKYKIMIIPIDSLQTKIVIEPRIYVYERNTTECWHQFESTGKLENDLLLKINDGITNLLTDQKFDLQLFSGLFEEPDSPSIKLVKIVLGKSDMVWTVIAKILQDHHFTIKIFNKDMGLISTNYKAIPKYNENTLIVEELLSPFGGWNKALSIWEDPYRCAINIQLSEPFSNDSLLLTLKSYYERYERNTTEKWHRFKSTGFLENAIFNALEKALKNTSKLDRYNFTQVHFDSVKTTLIEYPLPVVWLATLQSLKNLKFKINESTIDSVLVFVTNFNKQGNYFYSLSIMLQQVDTSRTNLYFSITSRHDDPTEGTLIVQYEESPKNFAQDFLSNTKQQLTKYERLFYAENLILNDSTDMNQTNILPIRNFLTNLEVLKSTSCLPDIEIDSSWIKISSDVGKKSLTTTLLLLKPFDTNDPLHNQQIIDALFEQVICRLALALPINFLQASGINELHFQLLFKFHNLDDLTPINNKYRDCHISIQTADLINFIKFETDIQDLIKRSILFLDSEEALKM